MIEQKVTIELRNNLGGVGTLYISAINPRGFSESNHSINNYLELENIDLVEKPDNVTPIQYCADKSSHFANLMLLEETDYQILFESRDVDASYEILHSLVKMNDKFFNEFRFSLNEFEKYKVVGTLNFKSYVGKSFLDVNKNGYLSNKVPIEVRSKKIDYFNQYSAMIAELSQHALGIIFETNSPLYQEFEIDYKNKTTYYEDFMFLEYLFRPENLPSIFEYLSKNLYSRLEEYDEIVPTSFASNIGGDELINILNNPDKLQKTESDIKLANYLNGFLPLEVDEISYKDSVDVAENRFLKYFLELVRDLIEKLLANSKEGYIQDKLRFFDEEVIYYLSNKLFTDIGTLDYIPYNSQVLQKKEGYRDIFQFFLMLEFSFKLSWDELNNQFKGFEKKLSELYEYWCYFKILKVLNEMSSSKVDFEDIFEVNKDNWSMDIKRGVKSIKTFNLNLFNKEVLIEFFYNKTFSNNTKYKSYSLAFRPDYSLLIKINGEEYFIHFDAKYRSELDVINFYNKIGDKTFAQIENEVNIRDSDEEKNRIFKDGDIYKMHTYKDSILKTEGSYVLYPGNVHKLFKEDSDFIIPSVGAFPLAPGNGGDEEYNLAIFIKKVIKSLIAN